MAGENFFEFREKQARAKAPKAPKPAAPRKSEADALTVSQLTAKIERILVAGLPGTLHVRGEVSNYRLHPGSGHIYFTLKDADACIDCVMFRSDAARLKFEPEDGIELLLSGRLGVYPQRGRYQLYVTSLSPLGRGALELAFRQLYEKLQKEGLFEQARKKALPPYPMRVALITSRATAALQDMLKVLHRFPWIKLSLYDVPVQGDGAAELIANGIRNANRNSSKLGGIDAILLGRGGGSLEDLWEFNEEVVARAIVSSQIPVITGIGHEIDVSIADLVADHHAHTPTEAAQVVTAQWRGIREQLDESAARLRRGLRGVLQDARHRLTGIVRHEFFRRPLDRISQLRRLLDHSQRSMQLAAGDNLRIATGRLARLEAMLIECHPRHIVELKGQRLAGLAERLSRSSHEIIQLRKTQLSAMARQLDAVSPLAVLHRGYTITTRKKGGAILRSANEAGIGDRLLTRFADGTLESTVEDKQQLSLFE